MQLGPVIILGMHRSGTSCLTGCLEESGLTLGEVVTSAPHNKKGNRENLAIMALHERVLAQNGGSWDDPPRSIVWSNQDKEALADIISSYPEVGQWGFKDPRTLVLIDHWLELFPNARLIGTFRHPVSVALSLAKRDNCGLDSGLALWREYNLRLLSLWEQHQFPIVDFDLAASDYASCVAQVAAGLGLSAPESGFCFPELSLRHNDIPEMIHLNTELEELRLRLEGISIARSNRQGISAISGDLH